MIFAPPAGGANVAKPLARAANYGRAAVEARIPLHLRGVCVLPREVSVVNLGPWCAVGGYRQPIA
jgi:hypothetical protein